LNCKNNYIPLEQCKDGFLYIIDARNSRLGIFKKENNSFIISRFKFKSNFLYEEDHWDTGEPFGTVKPLKLLGPTQMSFLPTMNQDEQLKFLNKMNDTYREDIERFFPPSKYSAKI